MEIKIETYIPTERQSIFHSAWQRHLLFGGAMGGGKSRTLCEQANIQMVRYPGNIGFLGRKRLGAFMISTYVTLTRKCSSFMALVKAGLIKEHKSHPCYFDYWNGSRLYYGGVEKDQGDKTDRENMLFSTEFGWIGIDEIYEVLEDEFNKLDTRLRHKLPFPNLPKDDVYPKGQLPHYQLCGATNPTQNWVKRRFLLAPDERTLFVPALPKDNPHNPADYIDNLRLTYKNDPKGLAAFIEGSWDAIGSPDDLLMMSDLQAAFATPDRLTRYAGFDWRIISFDCAYMGDDQTQIYGGQNEIIRESITYGRQDPLYTFGQLISLEQKMNCNALFVGDDTGGYGSGTFALLNAPNMHKNTVQINFSGEADDKLHFANIRSEMYWEAANMIKVQAALLPAHDFELHGQLCGIKYTRDSDGRIYIERKDEIKKRLGKSPDKADAYVLYLLGLRRLISGKINVRASWAEQKPVWQQEREKSARNRIYQEEEALTAGSACGGYGE